MRDERSDSRSSEVEDQKDCGAGGETVPERAEDPDPAAEFNDESEGGTDHTTTLPPSPAAARCRPAFFALVHPP